MQNPEIIGAVVLSLGTIAGIVLTFSKLKSAFKSEVEKEVQSAIKMARNMADADIQSFNLKIEAVAKDIQNLEEKMDRDIEHVKNIYNNEIRSLAEKIEGLREEVRNQHTQLVGLLTKLVSDR